MATQIDKLDSRNRFLKSLHNKKPSADHAEGVGEDIVLLE